MEDLLQVDIYLFSETYDMLTIIDVVFLDACPTGVLPMHLPHAGEHLRKISHLVMPSVA